MIFQEVLELNQLRQQAIDREQKLFIEVRILLFNPLQYESSLNWSMWHMEPMHIYYNSDTLFYYKLM